MDDDLQRKREAIKKQIMEFPESRLFRWSLRFVLVLSIANSILLIMHLVRGQ